VTPLRIGVLGAARIAPPAIVAPARSSPDAVVAAVAARDADLARAFADRHHIERTLPDYDALVADPDLDAIYNPLPNGLHGRWTIAALEAGKHVLCEKPFAANETEARAVAEVAERTGLVAMEAFHYRYHALTLRMLDLVRRGAIGRIRSIDAFFRGRIRNVTDVRWLDDLAPGSMMDIGTYPLHVMRTLVGEEPEVVSAEALLRSPGVDRALRAHLRFPGGAEGRMSSSMMTRRAGSSGVDVVGTHGRLTARGFVGPQYGNSLIVRSRGLGGPERVRRLRVPRTPTSYDGQLAAFVAAVTDGAPVPTGPEDAVRQMAAIDACYRAAGLEPRTPTP
jgi:predicted dehydrogenase